MKPICFCILLSYVSICAYSQQTQPAASSSDKIAPGPAQAAPNAQPFLRGETGNAAPVSQTQNAGQPGDLRGQLESLKSYLAGRRGLVEIPPGAPAGWWEGIGNSSVRFLDERGNTLPNRAGHIVSGMADGFKTGYHNALLLRATETEPGSPTRYTGFMNMQFHYTAAQGGINNFNGKGGAKTDYVNVMATSDMRTVGQKFGISSQVSSFSNGDTVGLGSYVVQYGGYDTNGDEQTEGIRIQEQQGSAGNASTGGVFGGVVAAVKGNALTYVPGHDEETIGEHRMIRDLEHIYSAGSITSIANSGGSPNNITVTGSGTQWSQLGRSAHTRWNDLSAGGGVTETDLAFCFDPLTNDGYDTCFPVSAIGDDNHLTLNLQSQGPGQNTQWSQGWPAAGGYRIYRAAWPTTVDLATHAFTASNFPGFSKGDRIDQVLAYNTSIMGVQIVLNRHVGIPRAGGGVHILNNGTAGSPPMDFGVSISGGFQSAIEIQHSNQRSGVPSFFTSFYSEPSSKIVFDSTSVHAPSPEVGLWRLKDSSGAVHIMLSFLRETATTCVLDTSLCVSARGAVAAKQLAQSASNDYAGVIAIDGGSSGKVSFRQPFQSEPVCTLTPTSDPSGIGGYWVSATRSGITANVRQAGRISFNYICVGNPD